MDIAKIRKKLKELKAAGPRAEVIGRTAKPTEYMRRDETIPEYSVNKNENRTEGRSEETEAVEKTDIDIQEAGLAVGEKMNGREEEAEAQQVTDRRIESGQEEVVEILTFRLMKEEFAFRISHLAEILRHQRITKVPKVPKHILGITSLRGKVIPVMDLKLKLSLAGETAGSEPTGKILIIKGPKGPIGAVVDKVIDVVRIAKSEILPPPSHLSERELKFIDGVAIVDKRFVSIINMEQAVSLQSE